MPTIAKSGTPSLATTLNDPGPHQIPGRAAVDLRNGDLVYLTTTGTLALASGAAANPAALAIGVMWTQSGTLTPAGEMATAYFGVEMAYGAGMMPGTRVYASATPGAIDDAPTVGGTVPVGFVTTPTTIYFFPPIR